MGIAASRLKVGIAAVNTNKDVREKLDEGGKAMSKMCDLSLFVMEVWEGAVQMSAGKPFHNVDLSNAKQ